jgi:tRNA dimethylallyltransferase
MSPPPEFESAPPLWDAWYLTGPTASGKTDIGVRLADRIGAEIISLDSMAVYRDMDIGTAKPDQATQAQCVHHLLDIVDPTDDFSVSQYVALAHKTAASVIERGKTPLFVGGTPLYLKTLLRGLYQGPAADWEFRNAVEAEVAEVGLEALHSRLAQVDPLSAAKLHVHDKRRVIRALEVHYVTGTPLSHHQSQFEESRSAEDSRVFVLGRERSVLHERINQRVERMFEVGLVEEVKAMLGKYSRLGRTAAQALGYREVLHYLDDECDLVTAVEKVKARTRQFARRQETWFRSLSECRWIQMGQCSADETVDAIVATSGI